ncbi:CBS domain-containing protein [Tindallia californiensis]|uniref:tRNA nucleotidyltransferase (CCA-adding enzyme) n=1 Tax=Tindallia californiensis TaxID=159292 RepID=A0A1H3NKP7_9FIRM|nr:CBS domain-containing protein [Tindallia californiensis]SDY89506.1 tRNA nucleotidyltransferase (CCA-adding enzyme) [Tindallia californiensis]
MKLITSHQNLDFDGLASMVACSKLHPDAVMAFSGNLEQEVKRFYTFYKNVLSIRFSNKIKIEHITSLIIVDIHTSDRIGKFKEIVSKVPVTIYDHHFPNDRAMLGASLHMHKYGACITILIEELMNKDIEINPFEATLFALGIYADTNCLTFSNTTSQDAKALSFLLEKEANLEIINDYIQDTWSPEHEEVFTMLLHNSETIEINHFRVAIATYSSEKFVNEVGIIANKVLDVLRADAVFLIVRMEERCYLIGRSVEDNINIPFALQKFKGAGHPRAASATVRNGNPEQLKGELLKELPKRIAPQIVAKEIMSWPVKSLDENVSIDEANRIMLRYGHTGMPVIDENKKISGIISRTDIEKAINHGLSHAPIKAFMSHDVVTIKPSTSLNEINELLVTHNIGRLPVVDNSRLTGIVTRTDLLKYLHGTNSSYWYQQLFSNNDERIYQCSESIDRLPSKIKSLLLLAGEVGDELNQKVYIVGGFVRDLLLKTDNWDLDFVTEGDGIELARQLNHKIGGKLTIHEKFGTAVIKLPQFISIDIVTARREYYEYPAALPKVERSNIWSDLFRRDFTINCMAIALNQDNFGEMIDYFGGMKDLQDKQIRVLYNLSFIEDPTRIFRAIRFAARFNFTIEKSTCQYIEQAISANMLEKLSNDRIREEIIHIIREQDVLDKSLQMLNSFKIFKSLDPSLTINSMVIRKVKNVRFSLEGFRQLSSKPFNQTIVMLMQLISEVDTDKISEVLKKLIANETLVNSITQSMVKRRSVYEILSQEEVDRYTIYTALKPHSDEALIFFYNDSENPYVRHYIAFYKLKLSSIHIKITGKDLQEMGIKPGPIYKMIMDSVLKAKVLGTIYDRNGELEFAKQKYHRIKGGN